MALGSQPRILIADEPTTALMPPPEEDASSDPGKDGGRKIRGYISPITQVARTFCHRTMDVRQDRGGSGKPQNYWTLHVYQGSR
jgi:hypothetical protein